MTRTNGSTVDERGGILSWSGRLGDIGLGAAVIAVVIMMIVPLTPWLVDLLISANIAFSVLILSLSLFIRQPLAFTSFPTVLLVATLYRLALNVSTTRLILLNANAGEIIDGFGGYMVGRDILIGAVIFGILAMVLFLVITKGAERVAEVAARFSLDALPGLQLAIDSDVRSGAISALEAGRKRAALDQKSRYYGALDGAMKFVRGDAVASLVITGVNIIGGLSVGMIRHGMSASEAVDTYGRLTVGDGLVTMIPALLVSTAAGFLVTRVSSGHRDARLGEQVGRQLVAEPRAIGAAALLLLALALVRGLPAWPFLILGSMLGSAAVLRFVREYREKLVRTAPDDDAVETWRASEVVAAVEIGDALHRKLSAQAVRLGSWNRISAKLAEDLRSALGLPIARIPITVSYEVDPKGARLWIKGVLYNSKRFDESEAGIEQVMAELATWLRQRADRLIGVDETQALVDRVAGQRPVLVRETVPKKIDVPSLTALLKVLVADGISLSYLGEVLEILGQLPKHENTQALVEPVRSGLSAVITAGLRGETPVLPVLTLSADTESVLEAALIKLDNGSRLVLPEADAQMIIRKVAEAAKNQSRPVLLTTAHLRQPLARLLASELPAIAVVKPEELTSDVSVKVVGQIGFIG